MRFGLCMIVKDEADTIADCLDAIIDACIDVVVVDTGSTDDTASILKQRYGITALVCPLDAGLCYSKAPPRNLAFERIEAPWILCLDADEKLSGEGLRRIADLPEEGSDAGYFFAWNTYKNGNVIEDYKLPLFRKGLRSSGCAHENMQYAIRTAGVVATWLDGAAIAHYPNPDKEDFKHAFYKRRLECAIEREPTWYRYHWFLGYKLYRGGDTDKALSYLDVAAQANSKCFPVECLNSSMLMAEIYAMRGQKGQLERVLENAREFLANVANDFEVKVNFRIGPWLEKAAMSTSMGDLRQVRAYLFPY